MAISEVASRLPDRRLPTRLDAVLFHAKTNVFRLLRSAKEFGRAPARLARGEATSYCVTIAESRTPLWGDPRTGERAMQRGKVHNLRAAARLLDRTVLPEGAVFSFWRQLGRATVAKGFARGRMLQEGCLVPATGGGLCQLSNALYDVALKAGCDIVERHAHSRIVPGSTAARGRDATVAWNYVDLRFASRTQAMLRVLLERDMLVIRLDALQRADAAEANVSPRASTTATANSCGTCDEASCFRHEGRSAVAESVTAYLVDENWPEFREYVASRRKDGDVLALPLDGARWKLPRYAWECHGFSRMVTGTVITVRRGLALRAKEGAARRKVELQASARMAQRLARALTPDVTDVVVAQSLLPYLWREGHLGGRRFSVLMTRLPMAEIEARLNAFAALDPERRTLADFRADRLLIEAERDALAAADAIVTPHAAVAALFGDRAVNLAWTRPEARRPSSPAVRGRIAFPGPTLARKGAYELREAARALDLEIVLVGSELEGAEFWSGIRTHRALPAYWLEGVSAVVQPALLEEAPRRLLMALANGVPVIATPACGLPQQEGLTLVPEGNVDALSRALRHVTMRGKNNDNLDNLENCSVFSTG